MSYRFQFRDVLAQQDAIIDGLLMTLQLTAGTISLGFVIGLLVASVLVYAKPWAKTMARVYVEVIRNTPLIVQLFLIFFWPAQPRPEARRRHRQPDSADRQPGRVHR